METEQLSFVGLLDWLIIAGLAAIWAIVPAISVAAVTTFFFDSCLNVPLPAPFSLPSLMAVL